MAAIAHSHRPRTVAGMSPQNYRSPELAARITMLLDGSVDEINPSMSFGFERVEPADQIDETPCSAQTSAE